MRDRPAGASTGAEPDPTSKTLLHQAAAAGPGAAASRLTLYLRYYGPVHALYRSLGDPALEAEGRACDFLAGFFLEPRDPPPPFRFLGYDGAAGGRFWPYVSRAAKNFRTDAWRKYAAAAPVSLDVLRAEVADFLPDPGLTPDAAADQEWARGIVGRAVDEARAAFAAKDQADLFDALAAHMFSDDDAVPYADLAKRFRVPESRLRTRRTRLRDDLDARIRTGLTEQEGVTGPDLDYAYRELCAALGATYSG